MTERLTVKRYTVRDICEGEIPPAVASFIASYDHQAVVAERDALLAVTKHLESKLQQATERETKLREAVEKYVDACNKSKEHNPTKKLDGWSPYMAVTYGNMKALAHTPKG